MNESELKEILAMQYGDVKEMKIECYSKPVMIARLENGFNMAMQPQGGFLVVTQYNENGESVKQWCARV